MEVPMDNRDLFGNYPDPRIRTVNDICRYCGCDLAIVCKGKGPHAALLRCYDCGKAGRWMSKVEYKTFTEEP
jgi:hypothetical protein